MKKLVFGLGLLVMAPPTALAEGTAPNWRPPPAPVASAELQGPSNGKWRQACGTALVPLPTSGLRLTGEVHVSLSTMAATRFLRRGERFLDVPVNPKYFAYERFGILVGGGSSPQRWSAVAPPSMKVQPGDIVTIVTRHQDDTLPCHFVPNLLISVRHKKT
ncbi:hypothetical protein [Labrys sp. WJW]|uniref:hypothetical protein n=1 Tax=Labrys sp. WJW TaxID=1737983 RepID=UPI0012EA95D8|nr:hypothetical protein [Labrys sp. WJW]